MPFNAGGSTTRTTKNSGGTTWASDAAASNPINATEFDTEAADIYSMLAKCITNDSNQTIAADISWNSKKITNLADPVSAQDAATKNYVSTNYLPLTGGTLTGFLTAKTFTTTDSTVPVNGMYLPGANTLGFSSNTTLRIKWDSNGAMTVSAPSSGIHTVNTATSTNGIAFTDGTRTFNIYNNTTDTFFGTTSNHPVNLIQNGSLRLTVLTGGGITVAAPTTTSNPGAVFAGGAATTPVSVAFSAAAGTLNCALSNVFTTTLTANVTSAYTISNPTDGQTINWFLTQDATGSRTMTWPTSFKWANGVAGVLSTAGNSVDLLVATYRSATGFWYANLSKGFA